MDIMASPIGILYFPARHEVCPFNGSGSRRMQLNPSTAVLEKVIIEKLAWIARLLHPKKNTPPGISNLLMRRFRFQVRKHRVYMPVLFYEFLQGGFGGASSAACEIAWRRLHLGTVAFTKLGFFAFRMC